VPVRSRFESSDFGLLHEAALSGVGLLVTLRMTVESDLAAGRLVQVLGAYSATPLGIYAIFAERGRPTSAARARSSTMWRVRCARRASRVETR